MQINIHKVKETGFCFMVIDNNNHPVDFKADPANNLF